MTACFHTHDVTCDNCRAAIPPTWGGTMADTEREAWKALVGQLRAEVERLARRIAAMDTEHRAWHKMADKAIAAEAERDELRAEVERLKREAP